MNTILLERKDAVALITLNRPDRRNAYTAEMGRELYGTFHDLDRDDGLRAIIVTGAGTAFCAGADLAAGAATFASDRAWADAAGPESRVRPWNMRKPIIAAINGAAVGIGATLPLQWDIRIASEAAKLGFVFTRRGIAAEATSTWILPRLIGFSRAMELLITGRILTAPEALAAGLVSRVVAPADLLPTALALAHEIATQTAPVSVAVTKRLLWHQLMESDARAGMALENALFNWIGKQPDAGEGVASFLEKRPARFTMSASGDFPDDLLPPLPELPPR